METIDFNWVKQHVHARPVDGHKKTFGHVLVIAGTKGKVGAAILCARAALHTGCGMVTAMIPQEAVAPLLSESPEIMYIVDQAIETIDLSNFDAIAIGPGIGFSESAKNTVHFVLNNYKGTIVLDADALTILATNFEFHLLHSKCIITPHPGEFERLQGFKYDATQRAKQAFDFVAKYPVNLVLKGEETIVVSAAGDISINSTGNDGLATAGSGDVLTGMIASLCAQRYEAPIAARLGVYLHGMAGDIVIQKKSKSSLVASDIIAALGDIRLID